VISHNTFASSEYGLLDQTTFAPRPNYWAALLWPKLMGTTVLDSGASRLRAPLAIEQLVALREKTKKAIVASSYAGTLGVPALFHRSCADELLHLDEGSGAKAVISSNHDRVTEFPFPEGKIDIDTAADYDRLCVSED
jgi:hypothetical protein